MAQRVWGRDYLIPRSEMRLLLHCSIIMFLSDNSMVVARPDPSSLWEGCGLQDQITQCEKHAHTITHNLPTMVWATHLWGCALISLLSCSFLCTLWHRPFLILLLLLRWRLFLLPCTKHLVPFLLFTIATGIRIDRQRCESRLLCSYSFCQGHSDTIDIWSTHTQKNLLNFSK